MTRLFSPSSSQQHAASIYRIPRTVSSSVDKYMDSSGKHTFYVQGVNVSRDDYIYLQQDGVNSPFAKLSIVVFALQGAQNVPGKSKYNYSANVPVPADVARSWTVPGGEGAIDAADPQSARVVWKGNQATVAVADYRVSANYKWAYHVNVVDVKVGPYPGDNVITVGNPYDFISTWRGHDTRLYVLNSGHNPYDSKDPLRLDVAINFNAHVTMTGAGPNKLRGVDQITVGFVQHVMDERMIAYYPQGELTNDHYTPIYPKHYPLIDKDESIVPASEPWMTVEPLAILGGQASGDIYWFDSPNMLMPLFYRQGLEKGTPDDTLQSFGFGTSFQLDVTAHASVSDNDEANKQVYTRLATEPWSFSGIGFINAGVDSSGGGKGSDGRYFHGGALAVNVASTANWLPTKDGSTEHDFDAPNKGGSDWGDTANAFEREGSFVPSSTAPRE